MAFSYRQVSDLYDVLKRAGATNARLSDWSAIQNRNSNSELYSAGMNDNWLKRLSTNIDRGIEWTGLPDVTEDFGRSVGDLVGNPEAGASIGRSLPRTAVDFAPMFAAAGLAPVTGGASLAALGLGASAALSGVNTYTQTDSPAAGLLGAATAVVMPGVANLGERAVLSALGRKAITGPVLPVAELLKGALSTATPEVVSQVIPRTLTEGLLSQAGGQVAAGAFGVGTGLVQKALAGQPLEVSPTEELLNLTLGQLPFAGMYLGQHGRANLGGRTSNERANKLETAIKLTQAHMTARELKDTNAKNGGLASAPDYVGPTMPVIDAQVNSRINELAGKQEPLEKEATPISREEWQRNQDELNALAQEHGIDPNVVLYRQEDKDTEHVTLTGREVRMNKDGSWRLIHVANEEGNGALKDKWVGYPTHFTKAPEQGQGGMVFDVPVGFHKIMDPDYKRAEKKQPGDGTPDLPQGEEVTPNFDHVKLLNEADTEFGMAVTQEERFQAAQKVNQVRASLDMPPLSNEKLQKHGMQQLIRLTKAGVTSKTQMIERVQKGNEFAAEIAQLAKQENPVPEAKALWDLRQTFLDVGGNRARLVDTGIFDERANEWIKKGGTLESFDEFKSSFAQAIDKGTGLSKIKVSDALKPEEQVAKLPKEEAKPLIGSILDRAMQMVDDVPNEIRNEYIDAVENGDLVAIKELLTESGVDHKPLWSETVDAFRTAEKRRAFSEPTPHIVRWTNPVTHDTAATTRNTRVGEKPWRNTYFKANGEQIKHLTFNTFEEARANIGQIGTEGSWQEKSVVFNPRRAAKSAIPDFVPTDAEQKYIMNQTGATGQSLVDGVRASLDPAHPLHGLLTDLEQFPDSLKRVTVRFVETPDASVAQPLPGNRIELQLSPNTFYMSPENRAAEYVHELLHGLTLHEIAQERANLKPIEDLRLRMIEKLPPKIKEVVKRAIDTGWYERYVHDASMDMSELTYNGDKTPVETGKFVYGFLNADEFVSEGFTQDKLRDFLRSQKSTQGSALGEFTNWVKNLLGLKSVDATALDEFMSHTSKLMSDANRVASVQNYAEHYFLGQEMPEEQARTQGMRVAGLVAESGTLMSSRDLVERVLEQDHNIPSLAAAEVKAGEFWKTPNEVNEMTNWLLEEQGHEASFKGYQELTQKILTGDAVDVSATIDILPNEVKEFLFERAADVERILDVTNKLTSKGVNALVAAKDLSSAKKFTETALKIARGVLAHNDEGQAVEAKLQNMVGVAPGGFLDTLMLQPKRALLVPTPEAKKMSWIEKALARPAQVARMYPEVAEAVVKGYNLMAASRTMALEGFKAFGVDLYSGEITKNAVDTLHKAISNRRLSRAVDSWIYLNQKKGGDTVITLDQHDPDVKAILSKFNDKEREQIITLVKQKELSQMAMNREALNSMKSVSISNAAALIAPKSGLKLGLNTEAAKEVFDYYMTDFNDPQATAIAQQKLDLVRQKLPPDAFANLFKFVENEVQIYKNWQGHFEANPAWSTAQRFGKFDAFFANGNRDAFDSRAEAELAAKEQGTKIVQFEKRGNTDDVAHFGAGTESLIARGRLLEANQMDILARSGVFSSEDLAKFKNASAIEQLAVEARASGVRDVSAHSRNLSKGAENISFLANHFSWVTKNSTFWARQKFQAEIRLLLLDPQLAGRDDLKKWVTTHAENILRPDGDLARTATAFTTNWLMGFNAASALANGTQLVTRGMAEMTNLTGRPIDSFKRIMRAYKEMATTGQNRWANPEHQWMIERATKDGERNLSLYDENAAANETIATNLKRATAKHTEQTLGQRLGSTSGGFSTAAMWMFRQVEQINNTGALLAGFDYYREQGLGMEEAYVKATEFNHMINDVGGRVNRSVGLFSGKDPFSRSTAMVANSMQSYMLGSTFQLVHYLKNGFFRPAGLKPHEIHNARVAAIQMLAVQFTAAGMLGMPFVASVMAVLDKAFPEMEVNKNVRLWTQKLLGSDGENGNVLSDIAMTGLPSAFGWDWQSRLSMGNTVPGVTEMNGFQPGQLLGAPVNVVSQFVTGGTKLLQGDVSGARNLLPPAVKKITDLVSHDGLVKDYKDRPVFSPTLGEKVGLALGFNPKRLSDFNAASRMSAQADKIAARHAAQERQDLAEKVIKGDFGTVKQDLLSKMQADPNFDAKAEVKAITRMAEELTFPRDLRREGGKNDRSAILTAFNIPAGQATETTRLQFRQQVEQRLGLRSSSNTEAQLARLMDQLKVQRPEASRMELRRAAEVALRGPRMQPALQE